MKLSDCIAYVAITGAVGIGIGIGIGLTSSDRPFAIQVTVPPGLMVEIKGNLPAEKQLPAAPAQKEQLPSEFDQIA